MVWERDTKQTRESGGGFEARWVLARAEVAMKPLAGSVGDRDGRSGGGFFGWT